MAIRQTLNLSFAAGQSRNARSLPHLLLLPLLLYSTCSNLSTCLPTATRFASFLLRLSAGFFSSSSSFAGQTMKLESFKKSMQTFGGGSFERFTLALITPSLDNRCSCWLYKPVCFAFPPASKAYNYATLETPLSD